MPEPGIRFGAAYYAEYQTNPDLDRDFDLMAAAGFNVIRVGESVWSTWEPRDGEFQLEWLEPVLNAAHQRGIGVILGTPTYAIPMWLATQHPQLLGETTHGPIGWGGRQEMDFTHPVFRRYAERVIRAVVGRYHHHPAIIGYQVDNEPGLQLLTNEAIFEIFRTWLKRRYQTIEALNREWGLVYWSHRLTDWEQLWRPAGNKQPQYDLAWRRFQAEQVSEYIAWQADLVREITGGKGFVTTCISYEQPAVEDVDLGAALDVAAGNAYYEVGESLSHPDQLPLKTGPLGWIVRGPWAVCQLADLMYSTKQQPFLVTETNAGPIGYSYLNQSAYDGQWRQLAWLLVGRGANLVSYWHWRTLPFGTETYWGGVLPHTGEPGRVYREIAQLGAEFNKCGHLLADATPDYDVSLLWDCDSKFALASQPPFARGDEPEPEAYRIIATAFTRGVFAAKRQQRLVRGQQVLPSRGATQTPAELAAAHPVLMIPGFYTAGEEDLVHLEAYVRAGGHLVLGPRALAGDREARAREERLPAGLAVLAGSSYDEWSSLSAPASVAAATHSGAIRGAALHVAELLACDSAEVLAIYQDPHLNNWAAVTTRAVGQGRITQVGTVPDPELAESLVSWLTPAAGGWHLPAPVTRSSLSRPDGTRVVILHNWSWEAQSVTIPSAVRDLISGDEVGAGALISLRSWDVRVFALCGG